MCGVGGGRWEGGGFAGRVELRTGLLDRKRSCGRVELMQLLAMSMVSSS